MENKPKPKPTNVEPIVKKFLISQKEVLGERFDKFVSEQAVLKYYLNGNEEFVRDFNAYKIQKEQKKDLLAVLTQ